ncbi:unnamed protein product, partial [Closterium sp. NIES-53]
MRDGALEPPRTRPWRLRRCPEPPSTRPWHTRRCLCFTPRLHSLQPPLIYLRRHYVATLRLSSRPPPPPSSPCSRGGEGMGVAGVGVLGSVLPFPSSSFCSHCCSGRWGGGCEGVGELGEWHWGGGCETIQQPSLHLSSLPPSAAPAAIVGGRGRGRRCISRLTDAWRTQFPDVTEIPRWGDLLKSGVAIFDLDFDAILTAMYAVSISAEGDCYVCVLPDLGIEAAALGASASAAPGAGESAAPSAGESALSGTTSAQVLHTFTLDSGASRSFFRDRTTLTPLSRPVAVSLADPSGGPVLARYSTVLPCPAAPSGSLSGLYLPSFSTNLVAAPSQVFAAASRSGMASRVLVSGLPRSLPPLPPGPAPTCVPCVEGRQRAAPHSSEFPPTEAPLQTLHMDVWGPTRVRGQGHERYFLLVVDDYSRYTTVFPLRSKGEVTEMLIDWIRVARVQLRERFGSDFPILRLHSDRGGEFSPNLLRAFCRAEGIRQTFMLPASPQQNGIAERRIGMVMDVA